MKNVRLSALAAAAAVVAASAAISAENWPQWRGPNGQGVSAETALPTEWAPDRNIAWKTALPDGHSSPSVWGDRIFVTAQIEGDPVEGQVPESVRIKQPHPDSVAGDRTHAMKVIALDAKTGKIVWERTAYEGPVFDARHRRSSFAGPTVATDGKMVYAYFGPEGLYAYDVDGRLVWKIVEKFHTLGLGTGASPILFQNTVIVQRDVDAEKPDVTAEKPDVTADEPAIGKKVTSAVIAYDKTTGKEVWKTTRPVQISWSTPVLVPAGGRTELVTNGSEHIIGYDAATGKELWRTAGIRSNAIHTPLVGKGLVVVTAGFPAKRIIAIRPGEVAAEQRVAWEYAKGTGYVLSNILYGDYIYLLTDNGIVTCLEATTGKVVYEGGRPPVPSNFMGSPVAFGGYIAMTTDEGTTYMLKAGPKHEIARANSIDEPVYSTLAPANGRIYIRAQRHLYAVGQ